MESFIHHAGDTDNLSDWLAPVEFPVPKRMLADLSAALRSNDTAPAAIRAALAVCLLVDEVDTDKADFDRLPPARAREEAGNRMAASPSDFMTHVISSWVLGQHTYWSVVRGLQDTVTKRLRLRVGMDEGGWNLMPGFGPGMPDVSEDRLPTICHLMWEAGMFEPPEGED